MDKKFAERSGISRFFIIRRFLFFFSSFVFLFVAEDVQPAYAENGVTVYFFWGEGCSHCKHEEHFLRQLEERYPKLRIKSYEVWNNKENAALFSRMAQAYRTKVEIVPTTFIGDFEPLVGYLDDKVTGRSIEVAVRHCIEYGCPDPIGKLEDVSARQGTRQPIETRDSVGDGNTISVPFVGRIDTAMISLPALTIIIAGLDGFNPCAFFVLLLLLSILVYARSRKTMLLIGGIFVLFSGFIYFLFMSAWLNLFLLFGQLREITLIAGAIALIIGVINVKDFFYFKKGVSLVVSENAQSKLLKLTRNILKSSSLPSMIVGTIVLALVANTYELLCTAGFPMVYTRALTLQNLPAYSYYLYLIFYNLIYIIPLAVIVLLFSLTLGTRKLTESQGRVLKLISGTMMLYLGLVLMIRPDLLNNAFVSGGLLLTSLSTAGIITFISRNLRNVRRV